MLLVPLMPRVGLPRIMAIAIAVMIGGLGAGRRAVAVAARAKDSGIEPRLDLRDPGLHQVLLLMGPGTIGLAATQVNMFVSTLLATSQGTGAVSWLQYAFRVMYLPMGLFGVSIATAVLPAVGAPRCGATIGAAIRDTVARGLALMLMREHSGDVSV